MIYTVTVIQTIKLDHQTNLPDFGDRRCVGYFNDLLGAQLAIKWNGEKLHDGMYNYVIVEEMREGLFRADTKRYIYQWIDSNFVEIDEMDIIKNLSNFGIG